MELFLSYFLLVAAAVGLSHIISDSSIVAPLKVFLSKLWWPGRFLVKMMNCYQCNGFWSGLGVYFIWLDPSYNWLLWGFTISLLSQFIGYFKLWAAMLTMMPDDEEEEDA